MCNFRFSWRNYFRCLAKHKYIPNKLDIISLNNVRPLPVSDFNLKLVGLELVRKQYCNWLKINDELLEYFCSFMALYVKSNQAIEPLQWVMDRLPLLSNNTQYNKGRSGLKPIATAILIRYLSTRRKFVKWKSHPNSNFKFVTSWRHVHYRAR